MTADRIKFLGKKLIAPTVRSWSNTGSRDMQLHNEKLINSARRRSRVILLIDNLMSWLVGLV